MTAYIATLRVSPDVTWWVPLAMLPWDLRARRISPSAGLILIYAGWLILSVLTPFYHPYARLWLPLHAFECVWLGGIAGLASTCWTWNRAAPRLTWRGWFAFLPRMAFALHLLFYLLPSQPGDNRKPAWAVRNSTLPGLLVPTDSLKKESIAIAHDFPKDVKTLRVYARPPASFYLGQTALVALESQASLRELLRPGDGATWALLDTALVRQDENLKAELKRSSPDWILAGTFRAPPSMPVLLDIDPAAAFDENASAQVELRLFRPRRAGDPQ